LFREVVVAGVNLPFQGAGTTQTEGERGLDGRKLAFQ
jgi:hypothetical protein